MAYPEHIIRRALELKEGRSAGAVLRILEEEFHEEVASLNVRTILRWKRTKSEALIEPSIRITKEQEIIPPSVPENWKEHNGQLADIANCLLSNDLNSVLEYRPAAHNSASDEQNGSNQQVKYIVTSRSGDTHITKEQLSAQLYENIDLAIHKYTRWFLYICFLPHLESELPEEIKSEGFWIGIVEEHPFYLISTLRLLAARKTFKGTCPVCEDW